MPRRRPLFSKRITKAIIHDANFHAGEVADMSGKLERASQTILRAMTMQVPSQDIRKSINDLSDFIQKSKRNAQRQKMHRDYVRWLGNIHGLTNNAATSMSRYKPAVFVPDWKRDYPKSGRHAEDVVKTLLQLRDEASTMYHNTYKL